MYQPKFTTIIKYNVSRKNRITGISKSNLKLLKHKVTYVSFEKYGYVFVAKTGCVIKVLKEFSVILELPVFAGIVQE